MRVVVTGCTGFVGAALCKRLLRDGDVVVGVGRDVASITSRLGRQVQARPWTELPQALEHAEAVVHLAGASVAEGRWTQRRKDELRRSRVDTTRAIVQAMGPLSPRPRVLWCASAVGYFGDQGDRELHDTDGPGDDFLATLCRDWEAEATAAEALGVRVVRGRIGVVLGVEGGALAKLLPLARLGLASSLGTGQQWVPWVHLHDLVDGIVHTLVHDDRAGALSFVAPEPVRFADLVGTLSAAVGSRPGPAVPAVALRAGLGEASAFLLGSQRVVATPGLPVRFPSLGAALEDLVSDRGLRFESEPQRLEQDTWMPQAPSTLFEFFADAHNLGLLTPPWTSFHILGEVPEMRSGAQIDYRITLGPLPLRWRTRIEDWEPPVRFTDVQERGPYRSWHHTHTVRADRGGTLMTDVVHYELPLGPVGSVAHAAGVRDTLRRIFRYRTDAVELRFGRRPESL